MRSKRKIDQPKESYQSWWVRFENGDAYFMHGYDITSIKQRIVKYCPSMYCIDDKPNFIHSDDWRGK